MPEQNTMGELPKLLKMMEKYNASDLHIKTGAPPIYRITGSVHRSEMEPLTLDQVKQLIFSVMTKEQIKKLEEVGDIDFSLGLSGVGRFRINVFRQRGTFSMAARRVNFNIPTIDELLLPPGIKKIPVMNEGLVIVTGITGSGKSTTLASILSVINHTRRTHIITIEDPIEYLHRDDLSFVNQREVGGDVQSFNTALRYVVRQDPDIILVGEMRDVETFEFALTASETGHLVLTTLHSSTVAQTIGRILDLFPPDRHSQIRQLLKFNLKAIISQRLLKGATKEHPRVPAVELLLATPPVRKAIEEGEDERLSELMSHNKDDGMQTYNQSLVSLVKQKLISRETALKASPNPEALEMNLKGIYIGTEKA